jgi:archaeal arginyl aminopeptidase
MTNKTARKRIVILTADDFEDMEVFFPYFRLLEEGHEVNIAAPTLDEIHGENGYSLKPDKTIDDVNPDDYDLLIIPGGSPEGAPTTVRNYPKAIEIARSFFAKNKPVASICHGPYTLVSAGLVKGRRLTSYWHDGVPEEIRAAGGVWKDESVVVDGNLVTSRWPMDLPDFMREVVGLLEEDTHSGPSK